MSQDLEPVKKHITRFGDANFKALIKAYSVTHHMGKAMKATGFCNETCYNYLRQPGKLEEFKKAIEAPMFARIDELGEEERDWRAKAWCLERTMPERYALTNTTRIEHSGTVEHQVKMVPESELDRIANVTREIECEVTQE